MKLTTVKSNKQEIKTISNVFKLKKLIQSAANYSHQNQNKQNIQFNSQRYIHTEAQEMASIYKLPKQLKKAPFIISKSQNSERSYSQASESIKQQKQNKNNKSINAKLNHIQINSNINLSSLKLEKLKIHPLSNTSRSINKSANNLLGQKSISSKMISNKKIQCLNKSYNHLRKVVVRQQISIDSFHLGKKLGKGRFGNVYLAQQKSTKLVLALKIINKRQLKQAEMQQQLISEVKLQSYMKHPNILQMYGIFHDQINIYLLLQFAQVCLFKQLRQKTNFRENQVAYYCKQIIEGLKYLHSQNIIHRDLKPQNIMVSNGVIKLGDFGWSVYSPLYKRQTFCGTLDYVPPEIVNGDYYDQRVDIWSLGILIFQLSFGYAPFEGSSSEEQTFQRILTGQLQIPQTISESLRKIIKYLLIKDPRQRLNLKDIQQSNWLRSYEKQGRSIRSDIWDFWEKIKAIR